MKRQTIVGLGVAALAGPLMLLGVGAPAQAADSRFGNECLASAAPADITFVISASDPANALPGLAPSSGVVTSVRFNVPAEAPTFSTLVKIMRPAGGTDFTTVREGGPVDVTAGTGSYDVRLPVSAGDAIGLYGAAGTLACAGGGAGDVLGQFSGNTTVGSTETFATGAGSSLPVVATVEPDADDDGFGDTTQDLCPQSASTQDACPRIKLDGVALSQKNKIRAILASSEDTRVKVVGTVKVKGKKYKLKKTRRVRPGRLGIATLNYPKKMRQALKKVPASKQLKVKVVARAKDVAGRTAKTTFTTRISGTK